ncbi:folylpolyglutamate synthase/dihydrofolate synthase family protein [Pinirhizobacter sp.]|jgi:dihydrofolate synthase/folylpolyglutamate synthase|uniref:bifunctional folylpolyglutamate synthase/dihydrofolate synthase n=1 Tax=Pinirhizobacter sp. TaxID=2950432 RepID=UPI002F3FC59E
MTKRDLAGWLHYQERINPRTIELGLARIHAVWQAMGAPRPAPTVITVGGTNGKGSTVAFLEAMLQAAGYRVGCFTSPHLLRYNERIRIDGQDATDASLVASFERIEAARGELLLTYFEFGTLAAIDLIARAGVDVAVLEVGLGGRLDAVNIIDADVAIITSVDLDHQEWLGGDRDTIGREKAFIARAGRPLVLGEANPPARLLETARQIGAVIRVRDADFGDAPGIPTMAGNFQRFNAAAAVAALRALPGLAVSDAAMAAGLAGARVPARLQVLPGLPTVVVDVGHNPHAARALAAWLDESQPGAVQAVFGALGDKDVEGVMAAMGPRIAAWHLASLDADSPRGLAASVLATRLDAVLPGAPRHLHANVAQALAAARVAAGADGLVLAFGSFFVASAVLAGS